MCSRIVNIAPFWWCITHHQHTDACWHSLWSNLHCLLSVSMEMAFPSAVVASPFYLCWSSLHCLTLQPTADSARLCPCQICRHSHTFWHSTPVQPATTNNLVLLYCRFQCRFHLSLLHVFVHSYIILSAFVLARLAHISVLPGLKYVSTWQEQIGNAVFSSTSGKFHNVCSRSPHWFIHTILHPGVQWAICKPEFAK